MKLVDVYPSMPYTLLYTLLEERTPEQSISHKKQPTFPEHIAFVDSLPYKHWYLIREDDWLGAIYINEVEYPQETIREVGISLFNKYRGKGYGTEALKMLMERHPGNLYANINPDNYPSKMFFTEKFGAKLIQQTYAL